MKVWGLLFVSFFLMAGLRAQLLERGPRPVIQLSEVPASAYHPGVLSVKFRRLVLPFLKNTPNDSSSRIMLFGIPRLDALFAKYGVHSIQRSFESALLGCEGCSLHESWGFDQWMSLQFDSGNSVIAFVRELTSLEALVEIAEPVYKITRYRQVPAGNPAENFTPFKRSFSPDDPRYHDQWHLSNNGLLGGLAGKDIKASQAWDVSKGTASVLVGVLDGGVEITHPDLVNSLWAGSGYNFVNNSYRLDADEHGTHTAGIVAASTNNGLGVSGVAGGDGSLNSGAKIMSLEVFGPSSNALNFGAAFVWAADHGAVIAQNSWGYSSTGVYQQSILDGIDYFIAQGGGTAMKGGLVVFAAGNSNSEEAYYPAFYENVLAVSATNNRDAKSYYSNFGNWVDLSAPGGEQSYANDPKGILSTSPVSINGGYEFLQGSSMACPQVVGVAALVIAQAPGRLSSDDVKSILLTTTDDHYAENAFQYKGKLGTGRLNAFKALLLANTIASTTAVEPVASLAAVVQCPNIQVSWQKNRQNEEVVLAISTTGLFGIPLAAIKSGDSIPGGGKVIYTGPLSSFQYPITSDSVRLYFKIWSRSASGSYSSGTIANTLTPFSLKTFNGKAGFNNIELSWEAVCRTGEVLLAFSSANVFGEPSAVTSVGDFLPGGGQVIYRGTASSFIHQAPIIGINHYRLWVYNGTEWSKFSKYAAICQGALPGPLKQGFESSLFPPPGWQVLNPDAGSIGWERSEIAAASGLASAVLRFYNYPSGLGQEDWLLSPNISLVKPDSIIVSFDRAYRAFSAATANADTLELLLSTNCGASFQSLWKKGGTELATNPQLFTGNYVPVANDWKTLRLDILPQVGQMPSFMLGFRTVNRYGQQLYLDNVEVTVKESRTNDAAIKKWIEPLDRNCSKLVIPAIEVINLGKDSLKTLKIYYKLSGPKQLVDSQTYTGIPLPTGASVQMKFNPLILPLPGKYSITAYISQPNGKVDEWTANDTLSSSFTVFEPVPIPFGESFESSSFPPAQWHVDASDATYNWEKTLLASSEKSASAWVRNFRFAHVPGSKNDLYSPVFLVKEPDSLLLYFNLAHAGLASLNNQLPSDTLEVLLTNDCGMKLIPIYKKWGTQLVTFTTNPSGSQDSLGAVPVSAAQWREERVDLAPYVQPNTHFQLLFRNRSNKGNNLFLDNIRVSPQWLPAALKNEGWLVTPTLSSGQVMVRHLRPPMNLLGIELSNAAGQLLIRKKFSGQAPANIQIETGHCASGTYQVKLIYSDKILLKKLVLHSSQ